MWMMECEHHGQGMKKLRPLMPRPITLYGSHPSGFAAVTPTPRFPQNPNLTTAWNCSAQSQSGVPLVSSRWNPTPEQLQALEEMYRRGTRTPSAEQIQQIASKLRRFGKIEGKNVFYWFQNHKARERQKKRRHEMELSAGRKVRHVQPATEQGRRQSGMTRGNWGIEQPKKLSTPLNCTTVLQYSASMVEDICQKDRWAQLELQQQKGTEFNCCQLDLSSCLSPSNNNNNSSSSNSIAAQRVQENSNPFATTNHGFDFSKPTMFPSKNGGLSESLESGVDKNQTLQLFPVKASDNLGTPVSDETSLGHSSTVGTINKLMPNQFFEFLPTKN